jgi:phosphatidate cytidylyltransferase
MAAGNSSNDDMPRKAPPTEKQAAAPKKKDGLGLRVLSSVFLISFMCLVYAAGHVYYSLFLLYAGFKCYFELIAINRNEAKDKKNKLSLVIDWYFPLGYAYFLMPKTFVRRILVDNDSKINFKEEFPTMYAILFVHHTFFCALLLIGGLVLFTLSLEKGQYRYQFKRLGW